MRTPIVFRVRVSGTFVSSRVVSTGILFRDGLEIQPVLRYPPFSHFNMLAYSQLHLVGIA